MKNSNETVNSVAKSEPVVRKIEIEILSGFHACKVQNNPSCGSSCTRQKNA